MTYKVLFLLMIGVVLGLNARAQGCAEPASEDGVNVFGYLQTQYDYNFYDEPESNFGFNRARIGVMGNIPYDFSYYVLLETSPFKKDGPKAYLLDAFITYSRFSFAKVSVGSFKSPFGLELNTPCHALHTINRSKVVNELTDPDRDMGLMLLGGSDTTLFRYAISAMNGTGLLAKDIDTYKDIIGRVIVQPTDWMHFGGSFKTGKSVNVEDPSLGNNTTKRFGAELEINYANFLIQSEYIYGEDNGSYTIGGGCGGEPEVVQGNVKRSGMFVMALYNTPWNLQPLIKYENYNGDVDDDSVLDQITTFGVNYFFNEWTRLQVNYEYAAEKAHEVKNDRLMVQLQVRF
ncbi:porin [Prolixibacteraceae bacterium Z1-6]|uniref:Porin n=1 Tax=Draconibacterium aestuarii TaxID=2998507 RepID=A0A9X3F6A4_9BACT|nr:porin [Prolixibacteraceae bacterium Z1-6]